MIKRSFISIVRISNSGQNMIEYILVLVGVVAILVVALGPSGFMTQKVDESLNEAVQGSRCFAISACFDPAGCPTVCGNGCCEPNESCAADCS